MIVVNEETPKIPTDHILLCYRSMGGGSSTYAELPKNEHLNRLVSKVPGQAFHKNYRTAFFLNLHILQEVLTPSDPFWNSLLSYNIEPPASKYALGRWCGPVLNYFFRQSGLEGV